MNTYHNFIPKLVKINFFQTTTVRQIGILNERKCPLFFLLQYAKLFFIVQFLFFFVSLPLFGGDWQSRTNVKWIGTELGESLKRFADVQKIGVMLDRRIDPSILLHFESSNQSLKQTLQLLTESLNLDCVFLGSTVYFCPKNSSIILRDLFTLQQKKIENLPQRRKAIFLHKQTLKIPFLSEPKEILQHLATQHSFRWKNLDVLPYDLWDEKTLMGLTLHEQLTLFLFGFDLTLEIEDNGETLVLVPLQNFSTQTTSLVSEETRTETKNVTENEQNSEKQNLPKVPLAQRRFTFKVEDQRLDTLLQSLASRLDLTLELDEKLLEEKGISLESRGSFDIKDATAEQLFRTILRPLKLNFRISGTTVRVW